MTLLLCCFDLPGFSVIECVAVGDDSRRVTVMQFAEQHGCPRCGVVIGGKPYDVRESAFKDLPFGEHKLIVVWRKRRDRCPEPACAQWVFTERSSEIVARRRSSERLRRKLSEADGECRAYARVAAEYGVSWWLVNDIAARAAAALPVQPPPVRMLGIDETRTRTPRWVQDSQTDKWRREDPWMTSLTDLDTSRAGLVEYLEHHAAALRPYLERSA